MLHQGNAPQSFAPFPLARTTQGESEMRRMLFKARFIGLVLPALLAGVWPTAALAATASGLGSASNFAVLSAAPGGGGAVTCTDGTITGDVGSSGVAASVVETGCTINGAIVAPVS